MAITRQLYELQEIDTNIEMTQQTLEGNNRQLGNREALDKADEYLTLEKNILEDLKHQRRDAENDFKDTLAKITEAEKQLYGGKITNPKELSALQHEIEILKNQDDLLETKTLEIIEKMEEQERKVGGLVEDYAKLEEKWHQEQAQLAKDIELLKKTLEDLNKQRQETVERIDPEAVDLYERVRQQKKQPVSKVEQGICRACRISLSAAALQKARSGQPVLCGTCGRILYIS